MSEELTAPVDDKLPPILCPAQGHGKDHCWHEVERSRFSAGVGAGAIGNLTKTERCCYCPKVQVLHFRLEKDPEHGPNAPPLWVKKA